MQIVVESFLVKTAWLGKRNGSEVNKRLCHLFPINIQIPHASKSHFRCLLSAQRLRPFFRSHTDLLKYLALSTKIIKHFEIQMF
jgi:hypothetical protein